MAMLGVLSARDRGSISGGGHITVKVKSQDGNEVFFRIKRSTQLKKLMNGYCVRQSVDLDTVAFLFDDLRLRGEQTPEQLGLEDGDEIDAISNEETKPSSGVGYMKLKVKGTDGKEVFFWVRGSTQLKKIMSCYCELQSVDYHSFVFMFDGRRLRGEQTPDELAMEEGDEIYVLTYQTGC